MRIDDTRQMAIERTQNQPLLIGTKSLVATNTRPRLPKKCQITNTENNWKTRYRLPWGSNTDNDSSTWYATNVRVYDRCNDFTHCRTWKSESRAQKAWRHTRTIAKNSPFNICIALRPDWRNMLTSTIQKNFPLRAVPRVALIVLAGVVWARFMKTAVKTPELKRQEINECEWHNIHYHE